MHSTELSGLNAIMYRDIIENHASAYQLTLQMRTTLLSSKKLHRMTSRQLHVMMLSQPHTHSYTLHNADINQSIYAALSPRGLPRISMLKVSSLL